VALVRALFSGGAGTGISAFLWRPVPLVCSRMDGLSMGKHPSQIRPAGPRHFPLMYRDRGKFQRKSPTNHNSTPMLFHSRTHSNREWRCSDFDHHGKRSRCLRTPADDVLALEHSEHKQLPTIEVRERRCIHPEKLHLKGDQTATLLKLLRMTRSSHISCPI
jgi:hypothetical protein